MAPEFLRGWGVLKRDTWLGGRATRDEQHSCFKQATLAWLFWGAWSCISMGSSFFCLEYLHMGWLGQSVPGDYEGAWPRTRFEVHSSHHLPAEHLLSESVHPTQWPVTVLTTFLQKDIFFSFPFLAESLVPGELYRKEKINIKWGIKTLGTWTWNHITPP